MGLLNLFLKKNNFPSEFSEKEYNDFNSKMIFFFKKKYDLSTIDGIRSIPVSEANRYSDGGKSVVYMPEQILNRTAAEYKKQEKYDLAIECLRKANELYPHSFYSYNRDNYERLVDMLILAQQYNEAKIEHSNLDLKYGTKLSELQKLQKTAPDKENYQKLVIDPYIEESNDKEHYYWLLENYHNLAPKSFGSYRRIKNQNTQTYKEICSKLNADGIVIEKVRFWK